MSTTVQAEAPASAAGPAIRDDLTAEQYHADKASISSTWVFSFGRRGTLSLIHI